MTRIESDRQPGTSQHAANARAALTFSPEAMVAACSRVDRLSYLGNVARGESPEGGPLAHAGDDARIIAAHILSDLRLPREHPYVHPGIADGLEASLLPAAREVGFDPVLFAGLAAVIYGSPRAVSADIDFVLPYSDSAANQIKMVMAELSAGQDVPIAVFKWDIAPCLGARGSVRSSRENTEVAIDANLIPRFALRDGFNFEFPFDTHDLFMCRTLACPDGARTLLAPPEHMVVHKLVMARGADVDKFDLLDVGAILGSCPIDPHMVGKLIAMQRYIEARPIPLVEPTTEPIDAARIATDVRKIFEGDLGLSTEFFKSLGITQEVFQRVISAQMPTVGQGVSDAVLEVTLTQMKQAAIASRLIDSLDRVAKEIAETAPESPGVEWSKVPERCRILAHKIADMTTTLLSARNA